MRTIGFWLLAGMIILAVACDRAEVVDIAVCDYTDQTAVTLDLLDENGDPQRLVRVSYRLNGGPWQDSPEIVNETAVLRNGPGTYQIRVEKPGYAPNEITVIVPEPDGAGCELAGETAVLPLALAICPDLSLANLEIEIAAPNQDLAVTAFSAAGGVQQLDCADAACQTYLLPLSGAGELMLGLDELGGFGPMQVEDGVVRYQRQNSQLTLRQNGLQSSATVSGADSLQALLDITLDEVGCPLADFRTLEIQTEPDDSSGEPYPRLHVSQLNSLTITDLGADACQASPQLLPVRYEAALPNGTTLADVSVQTSIGAGWQPAACSLEDGRFLCTALLPNPLINRPYAYKIVVGTEEAIGSSLPFDNLCMLFD
ncbi:MAG: hypothetical protein KC445_14555 [Anaerolineales bacterium]|nr:hypothetical protein [Anaerolineales bacterium]